MDMEARDLKIITSCSADVVVDHLENILPKERNQNVYLQKDGRQVRVRQASIMMATAGFTLSMTRTRYRRQRGTRETLLHRDG